MRIISTFLVALVLTGCGPSMPQSVQDGDVIFQTSRSSQSLAIQFATHSRYSHMGMIFLRDGEPFVFEASAKARYTPLKDWIARGQGKHYVLKRLKNANSVLTPKAVQSMRDQASQLEGKPYDLTFEWSDNRIYCSELVWKIYDRAIHLQIGGLQKLKDFDFSNSAVKQKLKERYGDHIPEEEPVISPVAMFDSPLLEVVAEG